MTDLPSVLNVMGVPVRLIYVDEAGTSASEPVLVVAAVIVEPDVQLQAIEADLSRLIAKHVPEQLQPNFYIHATEIFSGGKRIKRDEWAFSERLEFLKLLLGIPIANNVPIVLSCEVKKDRSDTLDISAFGIPTAQQSRFRAQLAHVMNFSAVTERADLFLRRYLKGKEKGIVIAEDLPEMRKLLTHGGLFYRDYHKGVTFGSDMLRKSASQERLGVEPSPVEYRIDHIIDVPHFVKKEQAPMLQLADLCAFAFRRFLSGGSHGADFILAMLGPDKGTEFVDDPVWREGDSHGLFGVEAYRDEHQVAAGEGLKRLLLANRILKPFETNPLGGVVLTSGED